MVTPEMLLWLAEKMGMKAGIHGPRVAIWNDNGWTMIWAPHEADNQFGRLVVFAFTQGIGFDPGAAEIYATLPNGAWFDDSHDSTPDSIRAAAVVAICRALGFNTEMETDK